ncbi:MAG: formylglycine-generating enzyme family protein, partial [Alloprevotella sp.]
LLFFFCLSVLGSMGQGTICRSCRKAISQCPYKGKHPKPQQEKPKQKQTPKPTPKPKPRVTATYENEVLRVGNVSYRMKYVSGGTFTMGSTSEMENPYDDEKPTHQVTLSSYYIGETEVTQALWKAVMGSNPSNFKGDNLPVEQVSWDDCQTFIDKLYDLTGKRFRLPTEAEWEFAARGGNLSRHTQYSGSSRIDDVAWYKDNSGNKTYPVKTKQPNELGIYDMTGNVREWCQDQNNAYSSFAQTDPCFEEENSGSNRVNRGGSWYNSPRSCRSSERADIRPSFSDASLGLRLALSE